MSPAPTAPVRPRLPAVGSLLVVLAGLGLAVEPSAAVAPAQSGQNLVRPPTWHVRYDAPGIERAFVVMRPGWLIRPGSAAIFWDPAWRAEGAYVATLTTSLFPAGVGMPPSDTGAPYGVVIGAARLETAEPSYAAFLIRNDGTFSVERRVGSAVRRVVPWTIHDRIATLGPGDVGVAHNRLTVAVAADGVRLAVNGVNVVHLDRDALSFDGSDIGLRVGDGLALHVRDLTIAR